MSATQSSNMWGKVVYLAFLASSYALSAPPLEDTTPPQPIPSTTLPPALGIEPLFDAEAKQENQVAFQAVAAVPSPAAAAPPAPPAPAPAPAPSVASAPAPVAITVPPQPQTPAAPPVTPAFVRSESQTTPAPPPQQLTARERQALIGHLDGNFDQTAIVLTDKQRLAIFQERRFRSQGFGAFSPASDGNNQQRFQEQPRQQQNQQFSPQLQNRQQFSPSQQPQFPPQQQQNFAPRP